MVKACPTLIPYVYDFLENKAYSKGKGEFARKVSKLFFFFFLTYEYFWKNPGHNFYCCNIFLKYLFLAFSDRHLCKSPAELHKECLQRSEISAR